tara:strand:- start:279 stop:1184 length:906 start_codon:yes stop_codon:yes gene_type:complete
MTLHVHNILDYIDNALASPQAEICSTAVLAVIKRSLIKAGKFDLGTIEDDAWEVLQETGERMREEDMLSLPYDTTYFEMTTDGARTGMLFIPFRDLSDHIDIRYEEKDEHGQAVKLIEDNDDVWLAVVFFPDTHTRHGWVSLRFAAIILMSDSVYSLGVDLYANTVQSKAIPRDEKSDAISQLTHSTWSFLRISAALLSTRHVSIVAEPAPHKLNKSRTKKGKHPLFEHHVVKIKGVSISGNIIGDGRTRASPRKHWRRGHVRVTGRDTLKERKTLIPAMLVGERGFISKDYITEDQTQHD